MCSRLHSPVRSFGPPADPVRRLPSQACLRACTCGDLAHDVCRCCALVASWRQNDEGKNQCVLSGGLPICVEMVRSVYPHLLSIPHRCARARPIARPGIVATEICCLLPRYTRRPRANPTKIGPRRNRRGPTQKPNRYAWDARTAGTKHTCCPHSVLATRQSTQCADPWLCAPTSRWVCPFNGTSL